MRFGKGEDCAKGRGQAQLAGSIQSAATFDR
jgi:hypothetical protein